jgi:hypothetical protein
MVNIAIIDKNETFCDSLKIILEQVEDFKVKIYNSENSFSGNDIGFVPDVLLLDTGFGKERCKQISKKVYGTKWPDKILLMVMFKDELYLDFYNTPMILKSSCAKEFENRIRELANLEMPQLKNQSIEKNKDDNF